MGFMELALLAFTTVLSLAMAALTVIVLVVVAGALIEVVTAGQVNFGITTRPWRRSKR